MGLVVYPLVGNEEVSVSDIGLDNVGENGVVPGGVQVVPLAVNLYNVPCVGVSDSFVPTTTVLSMPVRSQRYWMLFA